MKRHQKIYLVFKRMIDLLGSIVGIIFCALIFWWWVLPINCISTKGSPFFIHERVGRDRKTFKVVKFRSMYNHVNPYSTSEYAKYSEMVTPFGKFLRKTSIDETPQLFNILIGQMSFIGPRPVIDAHEDRITIEERERNGAINLRPGLGGYAQVHGRVNVNPKEKGELDGLYYKKISLWLDIKLFIMTITDVFKSKNVEKNNG